MGRIKQTRMPLSDKIIQWGALVRDRKTTGKARFLAIRNSSTTTFREKAEDPPLRSLKL